MRFAILSIALVALALSACTGANPCNPAQPMGYSTAVNPSNPCNPAPMAMGVSDDCGLPVYGGPICAPQPVMAAPLIIPAAAPCSMPTYAQSVPMAMATAAPGGKCGALPPEARPGETWCCVMVQPPAAAPQRVCVAEECSVCIPVPAVFQTRQRQVMAAAARTEWQQIQCDGAPVGTQECWKLVQVPAQYRTECYEECVQPATTRTQVTPAKFQMVPSAAPPPYYEWRKTDCGVPMTASAPCGDLPMAPALGSPDGN